jgi:hypothetical protein
VTAWDEVRARRGIAAIVGDAEASSVDGAWPIHALDAEPDDPPQFNGVYLGTAGMVWALHRLGSGLDHAALVDAALVRFRSVPDERGAERGLLLGETGMQVVAQRLGGTYDADRLRALVTANERNPTWELLWGSPGTMLAARAVGLDAEWERSAEILLEEWDRSDGMWTQLIRGKARQYLGPAHGFAGNVHALRGYVDDDELRRRVEPVLRKHAIVGGDTVNWPPTVGADADRVQWCHGAAGMVATVGDLMPRDLMVAAAEQTWRTGPLEKGSGLCHGTAGNGYALLRAHELTGDDLWLDRARSFAMDALAQVEAAPGRHSLFTGDVGAALFAQACIDVDPRFPIMDVW